MMKMINELKAWADKWKVPYEVDEFDELIYIKFKSCTWSEAQIEFNKKTGQFTWYGGD